MLPTRPEFRGNRLSDSHTVLRGLNEFITATSVRVLIDTAETRYRKSPQINLLAPELFF